MPDALMSKLLMGVAEDKEDDGTWEDSGEPRPTRLGLGADPKALHQKRDRTSADRRIANMVKKDAHDSSSSDDEGTRANIGQRKNV